MHGIHIVFPPPAMSGHNEQDPISVKKLVEGEGLWEVRKGILGWITNKALHCIELFKKKQKELCAKLQAIVCI